MKLILLKKLLGVTFLILLIFLNTSTSFLCYAQDSAKPNNHAADSKISGSWTRPVSGPAR